MKNSLKVKMCFLSIFMLVVGIIGGILLYREIYNSKFTTCSDFYEVDIEKNNDCDKKAVLYYEGKERNIYTYCLSGVKVNGLELKDLLKEDEENIDDIILELGKSEKFWDGGTELYKDGGSVKFTGESMNLLKCKTLDGNKDIYIGSSDMGYEEGFCEREVEVLDEKFIRTYEVLHIAPSNDEAYLYITIRQFQAESVDTVKVNKSVFSDYEIGKNYEFTFQKLGFEIEDNTESIFNNTRLFKVEETEKLGLVQINEDI